MPDVLTESDLFMNLDPNILLNDSSTQETQDKGRGPADGWSSQLLDDSQLDVGASPSKSRMNRDPALMEQPRLEDDTGLVLDLGEDEIPLGNNDTSIEAGRDAPAPRPVGDDLFSDNVYDGDLTLDLGDDNAPLNKDSVLGQNDQMDDLLPMDHQDDTIMGGGMDDNIVTDNIQPQDEAGAGAALSERARSPSMTPPSSEAPEARGNENEDHDVVRHEQRIKRRRVIPVDLDTFISIRDLKAQRADRSKILKDSDLLPRDPLFLTLMNMHNSRSFASDVMQGGSAANLFAPELRNMLSINTVKDSSEKKRKRDVIAPRQGETEAVEEANEAPQPDADAGPGTDANDTILNTDDHEPLVDNNDYTINDDMQQDIMGDGHDFAATENDENTLSVEPVAAGTKHAVEFLRDQFGEKGSEESGKAVVFQNMFPEKQTSRTDVTKMFFEMLVLGTKDAVAIEQGPDIISGPIKVRAKETLWDQFAEISAGGEMASQSQNQSQEV